ncbi:MAG TPA: hypothetical protein VGR23_07580 [Candidatus Dormibacteraeota bacterium]|jgi:hypothetical protein|nr:hypothetical protein [Candidatus Dormibacteraeota bacterium]
MTHDIAERDPLGTELVKLSLAAWRRLPNLISDYLGPKQWLNESRAEKPSSEALLQRARALVEAAEREGDAYVAVQARAVGVQIEMEADPARYGYVESVERLLACRFDKPDPGELDALAREVDDLASSLGFTGAGAIARWEARSVVRGEAKWDVAFDAYLAGRRYALQRFAVAFEERLDIRRTDDPITSLHLTWREPDRLVFEVNVGVARTAATTRYEVAHNIYPGDYLHMAVLTQRTYSEEGRAAAAIKLKNAPENVIAEGIEEVAPFRLRSDPDPEHMLAWKLEWLRRGACLTGALLRRQESEPRPAVIEHLQRMGHMSADRARQELDRIEHPLWGTYQYTYWLGRHLVEEADRLVGDEVTRRPYLAWLYGGLHVPETFLDDARRMLRRVEATP